MRAGTLASVVLVAVPFAMGTSALAQDRDGGEVAVRFADPEITESSGLAVAGERWVTVNDSGDSARIFVVDPATGRTERTVEYADAVRDVEALAPDGSGGVWVGDIGDNLAERETITLYRVPLDGGAPTRVDLRYPDGPRDAETLVRDPVGGDLYVVSKGILGGAFYRVPRQGTGVRTMTWVADAPALLTDGSFTPDGGAVLVRNYSRGFRLAWPTAEVVATLDLPRQRQGESLAVEADGSVLIGSEGRGEPVLRMAAKAWAPTPTPSPSATPTRAPGASGPDDGPDDVTGGGPGDWLAPGAVAVVLLGGALWWAVRRRHR